MDENRCEERAKKQKEGFGFYFFISAKATVARNSALLWSNTLTYSFEKYFFGFSVNSQKRYFFFRKECETYAIKWYLVDSRETKNAQTAEVKRRGDH